MKHWITIFQWDDKHTPLIFLCILGLQLTDSWVWALFMMIELVLIVLETLANYYQWKAERIKEKYRKEMEAIDAEHSRLLDEMLKKHEAP